MEAFDYKLKIEDGEFEDPDVMWQRLSHQFIANPSTKTQFCEELWITALFFCFYNREFRRSFLICKKRPEGLNERGIDVLARDENKNLLGVQTKYFPTSNVIVDRKKYTGRAVIHIDRDSSEEYLRRKTAEIKQKTVTHLKKKLIIDYDFLVIYLDAQFEDSAWLEKAIEATGLKKEKIRTKAVWVFKNEKITASAQEHDKPVHRHRYKFFHLFPKFEIYPYEFRESQ